MILKLKSLLQKKLLLFTSISHLRCYRLTNKTKEVYLMPFIKNNILRYTLITAIIILLAGGGWFFHFSLTPYQVSYEQVQAHYAYQAGNDLHWQQTKIEDNYDEFTYQSFDGQIVNGRIKYPVTHANSTQPMPVLIGIHALGRSQIRWFQDSFRTRPTITSVDKITQQALKQGYAVIAIDARNHGLRKDPNYSIRDVMMDLHYFGDKAPYEALITDTVKDHRVLLDWIAQQPQFDPLRINVAGYSMGGQASLLLAGIDPRINNVAAIVPPHLDDKTALVAPKNVLIGLANNKVWLLTADDDEYASKQQNSMLFNLIPSENKKHFRFDSSHILPSNYVDDLTDWL